MTGSSRHSGSPGDRRVRVPMGLVAVLALAGLLFTTSLREARGAGPRGGEVDGVALYASERARADQAQRRVEELTAEVHRLTEVSAGQDVAVADLRARAADLADAAGQGPVTGPTYLVSLDDAPSGVGQPGLRADELVVHQQDVQAVVNALWAGGAEAMTIMGHRVVSTTAVRCVGNTLLLEDRLYSPPYDIVAVGDPAALADALERSPAVQLYRAYVREVGLGYRAGPGGERTLPAHTGPSPVRYARADLSLEPEPEP